MKIEELEEILRLHGLWLRGIGGGSYANLSDANLSYAVGNMIEICSIQLEAYQIVFTKDILHIGCQTHTHKEWFDFSDEQISKMDSRSLEWWKKWKDFIFKAIELSGITEAAK